MPVRELRSSPSMLPLFARAGAAAIPGASKLPFIPGGSHDIPGLSVVLGDVAVDRDRLASYCRVCGFSLREQLPPTYPHMLAFPLHLALMTDGSFPFPPIGLVHIHNRIVQHRPIAATEPLSLKVWPGELEPHPRGQQFAIHSEASAGDELVWEEVSTTLRRGRSETEASAPDVPTAADLPATATWSLPGDLGRRYGSVSGDLNPIHVHPLTARLFGFKSAIAHGMWTTARCLAALEPRLPEAFTVEVVFRKPILLPATVEFAEAQDGGAISFGVRGTRKALPHLDGRVT